MKTSTDRILTTHVGSLARPTELLDTMKEKENGRPYDHALFDQQVTRRRRRPCPPAGRERHRHRHRRRDEQGQLPRLREGPPRRVRGRRGRQRAGPVVAGRDRHVPRVLRRLLQEVLGGRRAAAPDHLPRGPISYVGHELLQIDIDNLKAAVARACDGRPTCSCRRPGRAASAATSTTRPTTSTSRPSAEAMREEYLGDRRRRLHPAGRRPVADRLAHRIRPLVGGVRRAPPTQHVEALNHALRDIPTDKIRHHTCYGLNHGPRLTDVAARQGRAVHAEDQRRRLLVRGRQPAPHARVPDLGGPRAPRRPGADPGPASATPTTTSSTRT